MAQQKNQGTRHELNTLIAARRALDLDDLRFIGQLADFLITMIDEAPSEVTQHFFTAWMRAQCAEVDDGTRPRGSSTQQMLDYYKMVAEDLRDRVAHAPTPER